MCAFYLPACQPASRSYRVLTWALVRGALHIVHCTALHCTTPARTLQNPKCVVLSALDKQQLKFEIAAGANGVVWIKASSTTETLLVAQAIEASQNMASGLIERFVRELVAAAESAAE